MPSPLLQRALLAAFRVPIAVFYRSWELGEPVPADGPLLLVANHPNGLVDPVVVARRARRPVRFLAKAPLFEMPVLGAVVRGLGSLPVHRRQDGADPALNEATFEAVSEALAAGDAVCLFPEGTTHSDPRLRELRTGAARMALAAERASGFELGLRIVPLGLLYRHKGRMRSKLAVRAGPPLACADLAELDGRDPRAAARALTERIAGALRELNLELDRWEDLELVELAADVWTSGPRRRVERVAVLAGGLARAREREPAAVERLERRVRALARLSGPAGAAADARAGRYPPRIVLRALARELAAAAFGLPVALAGVAAWLPAYLAVGVVRLVARPSPELAATVRLLAACLLYPLWAAGATAWLVPVLGLSGALAVLVLAVPAGLVALRWGEERLAFALEAWAFLRVVGGGPAHARLRARRATLGGEIDALARRLGAAG